MPLDDPKRDQLHGHLAGLERQALGVEADAARRPAGAERDGLVELAVRLRRSADRLRAEIEALERPVAAGAPARADASARD